MEGLDSLLTLPLSQPVEIFLLVLVIILFSPIIFDRLKLPRIVGLILAGVLVGPYCLNLLAYDASFKIFGEVGILYLMFLAAVEIDMYHLRLNFGRGVTFGLLTFIFPMVAGMIASKYIFDIGWDTAALLAVMYAAHTLVSYPTVSRFGLASSKGVVIAVAGTIVAVLLALLALAEVVTIKRLGVFDFKGLLWILGLTVAYGVGLFFLFPWIAKYFFRKYNDSVAQFIFILAMVFISSLLASLIGLEAILGAFFGGLILNKFVPRRSALMNHITFVGNAIFIPYFLIGVGMLINVGVLFRGWGVIFCAVVMSAVALVLKGAAVGVTRWIYRLNFRQGAMMFGLTSGKAAATIAATMIGYQYGMLSETIMNGAVIMILICCVVATVTTEWAAKKTRIHLTEREMEGDDTPEGLRPARQLVAVVNPLTAESITRFAAFMRGEDNRNPMTLLFVRSDEDARHIMNGRDALEVANNTAMSMHVKADTVERYDLNVVAGLTNMLKEKDASEIVIGLHRRQSIIDTFFGSLTDQLVKSTQHMVVLNRCFIPVDTVHAIYVFVPRNAEYESGFKQWITRVARMAENIGRRVNFMACRNTAHYLEDYIVERQFEFDRRYMEMDSWDDFLILSPKIREDDLLIVVYARKGSLSHTNEVDGIPSFISHHMSTHNIAVVYPSQFGVG